MIKCVLFLHKGSNAEKIVVQYDIASFIYALYAVKPFHNSRGLPIRACYASIASCTVYCVSMSGLDKVYIKVNVGERRKRLKIWLKRNVTVEYRANIPKQRCPTLCS